VFDVRSGKIVGIVNMVFVKSTKESALSEPSGITYAIPVRFLIPMVKQLKNND
jgi:S1-C subfamily serine protease